MVGELVEEDSDHLGVAEDTGSFAEGEVASDDHRGPSVATGDRVREHRSAGLADGKIVEFGLPLPKQARAPAVVVPASR